MSCSHSLEVNMPKEISDKRLDDLVRIQVRERDKDTCQWCGKKVYGRASQVSHVIPKGRSTFLRWNLQNVKVLCGGCHINRWHGRSEGRKWFDAKYPERAKFVEANWRTTVKKKQFKLEELARIKEEMK